MILNDYMPKQIELEDDYFDQFMPLIAVLLDDFTQELDRKSASLDRVKKIYANWLAKYRQNVAKINRENTLNCMDLVQSTLNTAQNYAIYPNLIHDVNIKTVNLLNSVYGRYSNDLAIGIGLFPVIAYVFSDTDELRTATTNSVKRFTTGVTAQQVSGLLVHTALELGYTEYIGGNKQDDKVRPQHKIDNDFTTWHRLDNPPKSGYPGSEINCRCKIIQLR